MSQAGRQIYRVRWLPIGLRFSDTPRMEGGELNLVYLAGLVSLKEQKREQTTYLGCGRRRSEGLRSEMISGRLGK